MTTPKPKNKGDSFERYARAIQNDIAGLGKSMKAGFQSVHEEMATKEDIRKVREEMVTKAEFKEVRDDVKRITDAMVSKADLGKAIGDEFGNSQHRVERAAQEPPHHSPDHQLRNLRPSDLLQFPDPGEESADQQSLCEVRPVRGICGWIWLGCRP